MAGAKRGEVNTSFGGSLFLFDRKVSRYFRKDGHNWRKKKDGKTVKEAHERLKVGSVDMLHCYYAHGEENEKFQRRSYWMLEEDLMHIVLVHYREVKEKPSFSRTTSLSHAREVEEVKQVTQMCKVSIPNSTMSQSQPPSQTMGADSPVSSHTSEYEDAESGYLLCIIWKCQNYQVQALIFSSHCRISKANFDAADNYQTTSRYHPFAEMWQHDDRRIIILSTFRPCVTTPGR
ncbi:hypothetical protein ZIOFF_029633 [Zingiber officinale]|uniref:CG-1 domain-containing protein n=1 Tax=Zingiber officinale TaxID=94328 RepID=A0A8J5GWZ8_ZINOF|nr:hypothetical protein ZIOFF_029633 [Zingiber officinale]